MVFELLRERIREPSKPALAHSQREIQTEALPTFVHLNQCQQIPRKGDLVEFEVRKNHDGRTRADKVRVIERA